jgi:antitoxin FitA
MTRRVRPPDPISDAIIRGNCYHNRTGEAAVAAITIRNLSAETHRALKARAAAHHRSTEAEVRAILDAVVASAGRVKVGSLLSAIGQDAGGVELTVTRDKTSREPVDLG